ncbi:uncharacterized protein LOC129574385 [Sitodiplosis mosellana]|uniref:uncharacterized protein LOC129574385 n=1 Tax=Sitodiplosis mosellana TaxID=263140 RepID=UPI002444A999|nr:uncharacterized protein LOC129574385 [Sitodiplosis mosellana]
MLPDYVINCVHKVAKNEGFTDFKIETKAGSAHGDNFLGIMTAITLTGTRRKNGQTQSEELHLLCKAPPRNVIRQKNFATSLVFSREIYIYSKLLPAFVRFQREKGLSEADSFLSFPKVYACEVNEEKQTYILLMEDLRSKNYEMWPKDETVDLEHELLVMKELSKFHAISFAMKDQRPNEFREFQQLTDFFVGIYVKTTIKSFIKTLIDRSINVLEKPQHKQIMQNFRNTFLERAEKLKSVPYCDEFGIMLHGDCWNNNFLFQHRNDNKKQLKSICFVDWQLTHYSPPVIDVLYNIFSSTDKPFRDLHYEKLLKTYYSSLSQTIRKLGSDPNKLYTYENFQEQMRKYSDYALLLAPMIITIRLAKAKDVANLDDYAECLERGEEADVVHEFDDETQAEFSKQINGLVTDLVDYGYVKCE